MREKRSMKDTLSIKTGYVLPPDTNHHGTLFGGKLMAYIDDIASISATKLARKPVVTASTDSVDFLKPIRVGDAVTLEAMVTYTGTTSMEVFVKVLSENLMTGEKEVAAISFLTFVALDESGHPTAIPEVLPETEDEKWLNETAVNRASHRKARKKYSKELVEFFSSPGK
ncbi:acyl-CoA thioesterase [Bacillus badius]|uniref:Acyl-CoA hydrolase n=1 Tax=Bacillus badius TaxID=1455 RepID=A0ABR5AQG7_BACBA|nr:acyl-CoA thioesterase [Bacillus badius]KIL72213.1 Acyl-CoA hydrolase [Bacillus badius]KIL76977.1 Acyl-CoA hydrolase [Bacillus badius]KZN98106.1 acyl-CoA thioesterase [Bacillus badius]KZR58162.1 acyl-CoA thioesterase [Bacillus badius]MED0665367.1 acyl-CoA thioesterase [Bacillus badius]